VKGLVNKSEGRTYTSIALDQAFYDASQKTWTESPNGTCLIVAPDLDTMLKMPTI